MKKYTLNELKSWAERGQMLHYTGVWLALDDAYNLGCEAQHEATWAMACNQVADNIAVVIECLAELGVPMGANCIRALPCPPRPPLTPEESK